MKYNIMGAILWMILFCSIIYNIINYNKSCPAPNEQIMEQLTGINKKLDYQEEKLVNLYVATMNRLDEITQQNEYIMNALNDK